MKINKLISKNKYKIKNDDIIKICNYYDKYYNNILNMLKVPQERYVESLNTYVPIWSQSIIYYNKNRKEHIDRYVSRTIDLMLYGKGKITTNTDNLIVKKGNIFILKSENPHSYKTFNYKKCL